MEPTVIAAVAAGLTGLGLLSLGVVTGRRQTEETAAEYLRSFDDPEAGGAPASDTYAARMSRPVAERLVQPAVARIVAAVSALTPSDHRVRMRTRLAQAGLDFRRRPEELIAAEVIGAIAGVLLGVAVWATGALQPSVAILCTVVLALIGAAAPTAWLNRRIEERVQAIRTDLPDILDLLAISVEAGVGLEGALEVVTERFDSPLAQEITRMLQEMGLGLSRHDALVNLRQRSQVPELSSFVGALIQADALGMPLGKVLKGQAVEMRAKRRQWARERAAKLPVKILFPLVFCIFPAILIVIVGPAASQIGGMFG